MGTGSSYRSVPMAPAEAVGAAGYYLEREWGAGRRLGYVGPWDDSFGRRWYIFQCAAGDGSRWLIRADRYGNVGTFEPTLEVELGALLDVEVMPTPR